MNDTLTAEAWMFCFREMPFIDKPDWRALQQPTAAKGSLMPGYVFMQPRLASSEGGVGDNPSLAE